MISKERIIEKLKTVKDPELGRSLVDLEMIRDITLEGDKVKVVVALTIAGCPLKNQIREEVRSAIASLEGVGEVEVELTAMSPEERERIFGRPSEEEPQGIRDVRHIVAVASGKGGVGKTTVAVNLAVAMAQKGLKIGLLDADIHGPDVHILMGLEGERPLSRDGMLVPPERYGVKIVSMGLLAPEGQPIIWRGPLIMKALKEFAAHVAWGVLDFLFIDLPPGTGDAPLTVAQSFPLRGAIIVTTPQRVALSDVARCVGMFEDLKVPIIGLVENMSYLRLVRPDGSEEKVDIFGEGGGEKMASRLRVPFLGKIPLEPHVREGGDKGRPAALDPQGLIGKIFIEIAEKVKGRVLELERLRPCPR
ncbi:Mrp/NBP35 family ATP-binding protein [Thermosulfuriphilus sp.]